MESLKKAKKFGAKIWKLLPIEKQLIVSLNISETIMKKKCILYFANYLFKYFRIYTLHKIRP